MTRFQSRYRALWCVAMLLGLGLLFSTAVRGDEGEDDRRRGRELTVRCDKCHTINDALKGSDGALTIKVFGTCAENVAVTEA